MFAKRRILTVLLLAAVIFTACANPKVELIKETVEVEATRVVEVEATRVVEERVEVTRVVEEVIRTPKLDETPRIGLISAFEPEMVRLLEEADIAENYVIEGTTYHVGSLRGNDVVMFITDCSMYNAAVTTQILLDHWNISHIVFSGIAGGVSPHLRIGDVSVPAKWGLYQEQVAARETEGGWDVGWHDTPFDNFGLWYPQMTTLHTVNTGPDKLEELFWFPVDEELLLTAEYVAETVDLQQCTGEDVCLEHDPFVSVGGKGVSGSTFVDNAAYRNYTWNTFGAKALDMETAAVALAARKAGVPYIAFRSLSDLAGGGPGENQIGTFFQLASDNAAAVTLRFMEAWAKGERAEKMKVAYVYVGPVGDLGWSYAHDQGRLALEDLGYVESAYSEIVNEGPDAERVIRDYAEGGYDMIFATSFGYMDSVLEVAEDHPNVKFEHCTGYETAENVAIYDGRGYEGWYLAGITAGRMTESNILGYVAPYPIPEVVRNMNAFALGARSVNADAELHPVWIFDWFNPVKEREAAQALLDTGADVIARESDSTEPDKLAQEEGVYAIGYNAISSDVAPDAVLTAPIWDWGVYYRNTVEKAYAGEWQSHAYWGHMSDGIMSLAPFGDMVPQEVRDEVEKAKEEVISGKLHPFEGPIRDQDGTIRVQEGETMSDGELLSFDWLVEGVVGLIPSE